MHQVFHSLLYHFSEQNTNAWFNYNFLIKQFFNYIQYNFVSFIQYYFLLDSKMAAE